MASGVLVIVVVAGLLAGVVALNVGVLRLNLRLDDLGQQRARLRAENAALQSKLASSAAVARIQQLAKDRLGVAPATPEQTQFVNVAP
jgi:cell division protein FtsL